MAKAKKKSTTPRVGRVQFISATFAGGGSLSGDTDQYRQMKISGEPLSASKWIEAAVAFMKAAPDYPREITEASSTIKPQMAEAFRRRECDADWKLRSIENELRKWPDMWPPKARRRRT
jgi:hypothetical protein